MKTISALVSAVVVASAGYGLEELDLTKANCLSCMDLAMVQGKKATFNSDCFDSTGLLGCISVENPEQSSLYNGCQFCEFDQFSDVPCDNTDCPVMDMPFTPVIMNPVFDPVIDPIWNLQTCMGLANPGETIVLDSQCVVENGGLGCIKDEIDNDVCTGCRYCGFDQYDPCKDEQGGVEDLSTLEIRRSLVPKLRRSMVYGKMAGLRRKGLTYGNIAGLRRYGQVAGLRRYGQVAGLRRSASNLPVAGSSPVAGTYFVSNRRQLRGGHGHGHRRHGHGHWGGHRRHGYGYGYGHRRHGYGYGHGHRRHGHHGHH